MSHQNEKKESNPGYQRQFEPGKMGFLWLFYGFSTSRSKKPPNLTLRLTSSCHPVLTKQLDVTLLKNKSDETRNNEHSFFRAQNEIVEKRWGARTDADNHQRRLWRRTYPKKRASELMERGQRMQQRQGQGIRRIEHLYCGIKIGRASCRERV